MENKTNKPEKQVGVKEKKTTKPPILYGNLWAIGIKNGRKRMYENPDDLQKVVDEYFNWAETNDQKLTITGLALYCGFESRQSIYDYLKKPEFTYLKKALLIVENKYENGLDNQNVAGSIFALKNMGWIDKIEQTINHSDITLDMSSNNRDDKED